MNVIRFVTIYLASLVLITLICVCIARAENFSPEDIVKFEFGNDYFVPGGRDRWLTNQMRLSFPVDDITWSLGNDMYTPTDKTSDEIPYGDRPWDGYSFIEHRAEMPIDHEEHREVAIRVGLLGHASGTDELQKFFHNDLGWGSDPSWVHQNPSTPAIDAIYEHKINVSTESFLADGWVTDSYGFRLGNVVTEGFLKTQLTKGFSDIFFVYTGMLGKAVLYNTHLDGRIFQDNIYTVDKEWFVASAWAGIAVKIEHVFVGYKYLYQTREFKDQSGRHSYGSLTLGYTW